MAKLVSKTYGDALFEAAVEENRLNELFTEVKELLAILQENTDLFRLMTHPQIVKEEKMKLLDEDFAGKISGELLGLMKMLVDKDHFGETNAVLQYFLDTVKEYKHIGTAYVTSAMELKDTQKAAIEKKLLDTTDYVEFEMNYKTDAALIGGMVIRIGDRVVDSSVRTKLERLSRELSKIQLKAGECAP